MSAFARLTSTNTGLSLNYRMTAKIPINTSKYGLSAKEKGGARYISREFFSFGVGSCCLVFASQAQREQCPTLAELKEKEEKTRAEIDTAAANADYARAGTLQVRRCDLRYTRVLVHAPLYVRVQWVRRSSGVACLSVVVW